MPSRSITEKKRRLEDWRTRATTQQQRELITLATDLTTHFEAQKTNRANDKILEEIYDLTLTTLESEDAKLVFFIKNWLAWLSKEVTRPGATAPRTKVELPMTFVLDRMGEEIKYTNRYSHNPNDILKGRPGIDARVITSTKSGHNTWNVPKGSKATRTSGAQYMGDITQVRVPIFASVQLTTSGDKFNVEGELNDHAGARLGTNSLEGGAVAGWAARRDEIEINPLSLRFGTSRRSLGAAQSTSSPTLQALFAHLRKKD